MPVKDYICPEEEYRCKGELRYRLDDGGHLLHSFSLEEVRQKAREGLETRLRTRTTASEPVSLEHQVHRYILKHLGTQIDMSAVAANVGLSYAYFSSLFRRVVGLRFSEYLQQVRLIETKRLLETAPRKPIGPRSGRGNLFRRPCSCCPYK